MLETETNNINNNNLKIVRKMNFYLYPDIKITYDLWIVSKLHVTRQISH